MVATFLWLYDILRWAIFLTILAVPSYLYVRSRRKGFLFIVLANISQFLINYVQPFVEPLYPQSLLYDYLIIVSLSARAIFAVLFIYGLFSLNRDSERRQAVETQVKPQVIL